MEKKENKTVSSISMSRSIAEMAAFWDTHDANDFEDQTYEVEMEFDLGVRRHYIAVDAQLLTKLRKIAMERGIGVESLANLWLQERVLSSLNNKFGGEEYKSYN